MTTPPGWKLVPEEPTQEMRDAADALPDTFSIGDEWRAMFAVAPQPPTQPEPSLWALTAREALELIAAPMRPDGTWNRDREACRQIAAEALGFYNTPQSQPQTDSSQGHALGRCRKCSGQMKPSKAIAQTFDCGDEGTCSPCGPGKLIDCLKCTECGWSITQGQAALESMARNAAELGLDY